MSITLFTLRYTDKVNGKILFNKHVVYCGLIKIINRGDYEGMNSIQLANYTRNIIIDYLKEAI